MDPILKKLHSEYQAKKAKQDELLAKDSLNESETQELKSVTDEISALAQKAKERSDILNAQKAADGFFTGMPQTGTKDLDDEGGIVRGREGTKQVGTELVEILLNGNVRKIDHEGFGLDEKTFHAIQEHTYVKTFNAFMRKGRGGLTPTELKDLQVGIDEQGGFWVPPQYFAEIIKRDPRQASLYDEVRTVTVTSNKAEWPKYNYTGGDNDSAGDIYSNPMRKKRTGETGAPGAVDEGKLGLAEIPVFEGTMEIAATRSMLDDSAFDVASFFQEEMRGSWRLETEREIAISQGINGPAGIMRNPGGTNEPPTVNVGNPITADGMIDLYYTLPSQYRGNAKLVCEDTNLYRTLAKLKDSDGAYIFGLNKTTDGGLATPRGEVFLGKPIVFNPFMSTGGAGANVLAWGDFRKAYFYALRMGMSIEVQRLPREAFVYFVLRFRDGGRMVQPRALRIGVQN